LRDPFHSGVVGDSDGGVEAVRRGRLGAESTLGGMRKTYPNGQSKLSSGLTAGTSEREMKLPSTYTLAGPLRRVYSDAFLILACG
jgi:hypothetical protein